MFHWLWHLSPRRLDRKFTFNVQTPLRHFKGPKALTYSPGAWVLNIQVSVHIQKLLSWIVSSIWDLPYTLDAHFNSVEVLSVVFNSLNMKRMTHRIQLKAQELWAIDSIQKMRCSLFTIKFSNCNAQLQGTISYSGSLRSWLRNTLSSSQEDVISAGQRFKWYQEIPYLLWGKVARKTEARRETNENLTL